MIINLSIFHLCTKDSNDCGKNIMFYCLLCTNFSFYLYNNNPNRYGLYYQPGHVLNLFIIFLAIFIGCLSFYVQVIAGKPCFC